MKPIIFSTPMVQAILEGRKTQTRRVIKPQPRIVSAAPSGAHFLDISGKGVFYPGIKDIKNPEHPQKFSRYKTGDILWVRETWESAMGAYYDDPLYNYYKASPETYEDCMEEIRWRSSIHMPRAAARIFLRVMGVRVERVQDISYEDVLSEGIQECVGRAVGEDCVCADIKYARLWDSLNAKRGYGWDVNPWVWVYEFEPEGA